MHGFVEHLVAWVGQQQRHRSSLGGHGQRRRAGGRVSPRWGGLAAGEQLAKVRALGLEGGVRVRSQGEESGCVLGTREESRAGAGRLGDARLRVGDRGIV